MRIVGRIIIVLALGWVAFVLFTQAQHQQQLGEEADHTITMMLFAGVILVGCVAGAVVALSLIPAIGDAVGHFFYAPNERVAQDPHAAAVAKVAQGDYEGAVEAYLAVWEKDPADTLAASEAARIYCERLGRPEAAAELLEGAVKEELPAEEGAFLASRLVDVYWGYQHDAIRAREVLIQIAESLPDTRHAANAQHRILEIERALATEDEGAVPEFGSGQPGEPEMGGATGAAVAGESPVGPDARDGGRGAA